MCFNKLYAEYYLSYKIKCFQKKKETKNVLRLAHVQEVKLEALEKSGVVGGTRRALVMKPVVRGVSLSTTVIT